MNKHVCESRYTNGEEMQPEKATCGACGLSWCDRCDPAPSAMCHYCHGRGYSTAPLDAVEFFAIHAGWDYHPDTETPEQGRLRGAVSLALAERWAKANDAMFTWEDDFGVDHVKEFDAYDEEPETCEICTMYLPDHSPALESVRIVASLGCVDDATDEYRRVVEAELAQEARSRMTWRVERGEVAEPIECETWVDARETLVSELETRIRALVDDIAAGLDTGSERDSIHELTDALLDVVSTDQNHVITTSADGIEFRAELIDKT